MHVYRRPTTCRVDHSLCSNRAGSNGERENRPVPLSRGVDSDVCEPEGLLDFVQLRVHPGIRRTIFRLCVGMTNSIFGNLELSLPPHYPY